MVTFCVLRDCFLFAGSLACFVGSVVISTCHSLPDMTALGLIISRYYSSPFSSDSDGAGIQ